MRNRDLECPECGGDAIIGPAIMRGRLVCYLPRPARHDDVIKAMADAGMETPIGHRPGDVQGFMTRFGFRDRKLAAALIGHKGLLTSEDLW
jgi:hypothetical protein